MKTEKNKSSKSTEVKPQKSSGILRFVMTYLILMGVFFLVTTLQPVKNIIDLNGLYTKSIVVISSKIMNILGIPAKYFGTVIMLPSISLDVQFGCNGLEAVMIYSVAVLAYPAEWKKKLLGILAGFFILQITNLLRIVFLVYSSLYFRRLFEFIHIYIAQGIMIALSLGIFFLYLNYTKNDKKAY
jgi:exosortase/archaeosortase family protein